MDASASGDGLGSRHGTLTDQAILAISRRLMGEVHSSPPDDPRHEVTSPRMQLSPEDEARVELALVGLGAAAPGNTSPDADQRRSRRSESERISQP